MVVAEDAARGLDDASAVRRRVVRLALAEGDTLGHCGDFWAGKSTSASTSETEVWKRVRGSVRSSQCLCLERETSFRA